VVPALVDLADRIWADSRFMGCHSLLLGDATGSFTPFTVDGLLSAHLASVSEGVPVVQVLAIWAIALSIFLISPI
jgi:hypothetical protein